MESRYTTNGSTWTAIGRYSSCVCTETMSTTLHAGLHHHKFHVLMIPRVRQCTCCQSKIICNIFRHCSTQIHLTVTPHARSTDTSDRRVSHSSYAYLRLNDFCAYASVLPGILILTGYIGGLRAGRKAIGSDGPTKQDRYSTIRHRGVYTATVLHC